ncbi:putative NUDIX family NTP pyrophosphohydrolase [Bradyrhizobium sp. LM2.7]
MAPRANWKGFLRFSLVTCPVALYPATSESEKVSFNQLNRKTGHRITRSGRLQSFSEVDRAEWFDIEVARMKMLSAQVELLDRLLAIEAVEHAER